MINLVRLLSFTIMTALTYFAVIVQHPGAFNIYSFFAYTSLVILSLVFIPIYFDYEKTLMSMTKNYKDMDVLDIISRSVNILAILTLIYKGFILLPIVLIIVIIISFVLRSMQRDFIEKNRHDDDDDEDPRTDNIVKVNFIKD